MFKKTAAVFALALVLSVFTAAAAEPALSGYQEGNGWTYVMLGSAVQDTPDEMEALLWRVLSVQDDQAVLLSERILTARPVQSAGEAMDGWEHSALYQWLNSDFLETVFSADEQAALVYQEDLSLVSLPGREMLRESFPADASLAAKGTADARAAGLFSSADGEYASYWTRSEGPSFADAFYRVTAEGQWSEIKPDTANIGVRPVVVLNLEGVSAVAGRGTEEFPYLLSLPAASARAPRVSPTPRPTVAPAPAVTPTPEPAEEPSPAPDAGPDEEGPRLFPTEYEGIFPELTEEGFLPEGEKEFVYQAPEQGLWLYASQDIRIEIVRREDTSRKKKPKRWLEAEIFVRKGADQRLTNYFHGQDAKSAGMADELEIARENHLVFAVNGDFYTYRVQRNAKKRTMTVGVILRQGELLFDDPGKKDVTTLPTRDILALYPDGRMEPFAFDAVTGQELLARGVWETLCFGPILVENGEITSKTKKISSRQAENPRCGVGQAGPGHFWAIVVEEKKNASVGMKLEEFAELFLSKGCQTAFNLNGGGTANMMFMGEYLSDNKAAAQNRQQSEVLGIGISDEVR